jgi:hypothetical protein
MFRDMRHEPGIRKDDRWPAREMAQESGICAVGQLSRGKDSVTFGTAAGFNERELLPSMPGRCRHSPAEGIKTRLRGAIPASCAF